MIVDLFAPLHATDVINGLAEARDTVRFIRDDLADRDNQGIAGIVTELDRAMGILVACEALMLAIAKRDGMDLRGTVGDVRRNELAATALSMGAARD